MKKTGFNGYVYDFSVDYGATDVDDIKNIHKYLMKKKMLYSMYKMFWFIKKCFFIGSLFLSNLVSTTPLSCISMNNQVCKKGLKLLMLTVIILCFILLVLK